VNLLKSRDVNALPVPPSIHLSPTSVANDCSYHQRPGQDMPPVVIQPSYSAGQSQQRESHDCDTNGQSADRNTFQEKGRQLNDRSSLQKQVNVDQSQTLQEFDVPAQQIYDEQFLSRGGGNIISIILVS